jgi:ABC-2 type transport system ATP-binding protein
MVDESSGGMIEARGLSKFYGPFVAIQDISFSIPKGQIVAFLGPNGAGKTTTMKILRGYLAPSQGDASVAGYSLRTDRYEASKRLGYLPENGPLYDNMTPRELLGFFGESRGMRDALLKGRVESVVSQTGIEPVFDKPIGKLSRGYRQRVGMAQALLHDPDVLIMDEPTAGLDPNQIRDFRDYIVDLGKSKTIMISTHILQEVHAVAQRVLLVHEGRLVFDGTPGDLTTSSSLEQTFYRLTNFGHQTGPEATPEQGGAA